MELNEKFEIKPERLGDLYRKMADKELIYDPYYQRKFVWEEKHQQEFIRTILMGLPCPEIFVADGDVDLDTHVRYMHVIDGQQRLRTIEKYFSNKLEIDGCSYKDLTKEDKVKISDYKIGTVKLKYNPTQQSDEIIEIFERLNIGTYELTETEKTISKFSDNEFVLLARLISNDVFLKSSEIISKSDKNEEDDYINEEKKEIIGNLRRNPFVSEDFKDWVEKNDFSIFESFFLSREIYSAQELRRNNNTKDSIDMIAIVLQNQFHGRVLKDDTIERITSRVVENKHMIYRKFKKAMNVFDQIVIPEISGYKKRKYLYMRSNAFSLFVALLLNYDILSDIDINQLNNNIKDFCSNIPAEFVNAARNSNMDKKQREVRNNYLSDIIKKALV